MDDRELERGDALASRLIAGYWDALVAGEDWFLFPSPSRWAPPDAWATDAEWVAAAELCLESGHNELGAYDVLLANGRADLVDAAARCYESCYRGDDLNAELPLAWFPADHPLRVRLLGGPPESFEQEDGTGWVRYARRALLRAGDARLGAYLGARIAEVLAADAPDLAHVADYALPRMAELGALCARFVPAPLLHRARHLTFELLALDRRSVLEDWGVREDERSVFARWDVAFWAARLGWRDVFESLIPQEWYWRDVFGDLAEYDGNGNLLAWSRFHAGNAVWARALYLMETLGLNPLDGAIAWRRLRARTARGAGIRHVRP